MRVLVLTNMYPTPAHPRFGIFVEREVRRLRNLGHDVCVELIVPGALRLGYLKERSTIRARLAGEEWDILHVHYGLSLLSVPTMVEVPVVVTFHGSDLAKPVQRLICGVMASRADTAIVVDGAMRESWPMRGKRASVVACGVDTESFVHTRHEAREELGLDRDATFVLFPADPGRAEKRYWLFQSTMRLLPSCAELVLKDVPPHKVGVWLAAADCVLLTSKYEGSPVVTKEALCSGTRVVSVPVGDVSQQLAGFTGCRVADPNAAALASAVATVLAEAGPDRTKAVSRFGIEGEVRAVEAIYEGLLRERRSLR